MPIHPIRSFWATLPASGPPAEAAITYSNRSGEAGGSVDRTIDSTTCTKHPWVTTRHSWRFDGPGPATRSAQSLATPSAQALPIIDDAGHK